MELSERYIQTLEKEGFDTVYEWQDAPGAVHAEHSHPEAHTIMVTDGEITFKINGETKTLTPGRRLDIAANQTHSAIAGPVGAIYIVGEKAN
jgi:quercetin dioxygenase-like cupin family protein